MTETVPLVQPFDKCFFNVTVAKSHHEINLLTLFLSISRPTSPNRLYSFISHHSFTLFALVCALFLPLGNNFRGRT